MPYKTKEGRRAQQLRWRAANPDWRIKQRAASRRWKKNNPDKVKAEKRRRALRNLYGLTVEEFADILTAQSGRCAICKTAEPGNSRSAWDVDHNHETGEIRGILCNRCNLTLGLLNDDLVRLSAIESYLKEPPARAVLKNIRLVKSA